MSQVATPAKNSPEVEAYVSRLDLNKVTLNDTRELVKIAWKTDANYRKSRTICGLDFGPDFVLPESVINDHASQELKKLQAIQRLALEKKDKFFSKGKQDKAIEKEIYKQALDPATVELFRQAVAAGNMERAFQIADEVTENSVEQAEKNTAEYLTNRAEASALKKCGQCQKNPVDDKVSFLVCGRCKIEPYCSRECQKGAWPSHKKVCVVKADQATEKNDKKS